MRFITDTQVHEAVTMHDAIETLRIALRDFGSQKACIQPRTRIAGGGVTLSTMAAILPSLSVAGAKVYTTHNGVFDFLVPLYSTENGRLLAVVHGGALTEYRTAAVSRIAFDAIGPRGAKVLTVFGTGVQGMAHVKAFLDNSSIEQVYVIGRNDVTAKLNELSSAYSDVRFAAADASQAVKESDVVVTATRSSEPLFDGHNLKDGAFVAAVGSSKPGSREIDDVVLSRARRIIVESKTQAQAEAGDLLRAATGIVKWDEVLELGTLLAGDEGRKDPGIAVFKSVGIALADVALGEFVRRKVMQHSMSDD